jgi:hypothetical protein
VTLVRCIACGAAHAACGPRTETRGVDENLVEVGGVGELRPYEVTVNGNAAVLNLTEDDAKRLGGRPAAHPTAEASPPGAVAVGGKARRGVPNKARKPESDKQGTP